MSWYSLPVLLVNHVAEYRKRMGFSQTQLADMVCCSKNTISLIELGKQYPTLDLAFCIASALRCSIQDVFEVSHEAFEYWGD